MYIYINRFNFTQHLLMKHLTQLQQLLIQIWFIHTLLINITFYGSLTQHLLI